MNIDMEKTTEITETSDLNGLDALESQIHNYESVINESVESGNMERANYYRARLVELKEQVSTETLASNETAEAVSPTYEISFGSTAEQVSAQASRVEAAAKAVERAKDTLRKDTNIHPDYIRQDQINLEHSVSAYNKAVSELQRLKNNLDKG